MYYYMQKVGIITIYLYNKAKIQIWYLLLHFGFIFMSLYTGPLF